MKSPAPVPLIEVIEAKHATSDGMVKFKGKLVHPEVLEFCDENFVAVSMPPEILFDFKADELPADIQWMVEISQNECLGLLEDAAVLRSRRYVELVFTFKVNFEAPTLVDLNPYVTLPALTALIKQEGYKITIDEYEPDCMYVELPIPFADHVYTHYKKHIDVFEGMCSIIQDDMIKRLNKRFKKKGKS